MIGALARDKLQGLEICEKATVEDRTTTVSMVVFNIGFTSSDVRRGDYIENGCKGM
jgi:hypothetical protein